MSEYQPVRITMPLATVERIQAALLVAAASAEERASEAAGGAPLRPAHISVLPLSQRRAVDGFLADRAECLALLSLLDPPSPTP
jgi:hypothetical protein